LTVIDAVTKSLSIKAKKRFAKARRFF